MRAPSISCLQTLRFIVGTESAQLPLRSIKRSYATAKSKTSGPFTHTKTSSPPAQSQPIHYRPPPKGPQSSEEEPMPKPLDRPLGLPDPPQSGENIGVDNRTLRERRNDFVNYDKHLERRQKMTAQIARPYFKDFSDMRYSKGKTFIAPERILKAEHALYFPNLNGKTLEMERKDTTDVLQGKVSVVSVLSSGWAENQVRTFCSKEQNPELHALIGGEEARGAIAQMVEINYEPNWLKYWILRLFSYRLRSQREKPQWSKYFIIRRGFLDQIRESLAIVNQRVGYVYLLDPQCRIRWAGSAIADEKEKESLVKGMRRLIQEDKSKPAEPIHSEARADSMLEGEHIAAVNRTASS